MTGRERIPKRFIQTWKSTQLPRRYRRFRRRLRRLHPDYELRLFTDDEMHAFVHAEYPEYADVYDRIPDVVSQTDLFRMLAVHKLGGFYADLDVLFVKPVDVLREHACVFPFQSNADSYFSALFGAVEMLGQYAFGAEAGHPFLIACVEAICRALEDPGWAMAPSREVLSSLFTPLEPESAFPVYYTTGPCMVTRAFIEYPETRRDVRLIAAYDAKNNRKLYYCFGLHGVHGMDGSWKGGQPWYVPLVRRLGTGIAMTVLLRELKACEAKVEAELTPVPDRSTASAEPRLREWIPRRGPMRAADDSDRGAGEAPTRRVGTSGASRSATD